MGETRRERTQVAQTRPAAVDPTPTLAARVRGVRYLIRQRTLAGVKIGGPDPKPTCEVRGRVRAQRNNWTDPSAAKGSMAPTIAG
jgi:hypothetical protein